MKKRKLFHLPPNQMEEKKAVSSTTKSNGRKESCFIYHQIKWKKRKLFHLPPNLMEEKKAVSSTTKSNATAQQSHEKRATK
nr:hypothetical protein BgiMline_029244 [Biomphalaria glabrata]